jgi:hypothetical protein
MKRPHLLAEEHPKAAKAVSSVNADESSATRPIQHVFGASAEKQYAGQSRDRGSGNLSSFG